MTKEQLEQGKDYQYKLNKLYDIKRNILPRIREYSTVKIIAKKEHWDLAEENSYTEEFAFNWGDPIVDVFNKVLDSEIKRYEDLFESLGKEEQTTVQNPQKVSFWKKVKKIFNL